MAESSTTPTASGKYPILQLLHDKKDDADVLDNGVSWVDAGRVGVRVLSGSEAFRQYSAMTNTIGLNASGDLRGMVVSSKWRTVFTFSEKSEGAIGNFGYIASVVAGIVDAAPRIDQIVSSSDPATIKGMQLTTIAGTISLRALTGVVPFGVHVIYFSLEGWCRTAGLVPALRPGADLALTTLENADQLVQTTFKTWTDTSKIGETIWTAISFNVQ